MKTPYVVGPPVRLPDNFFGRTGQTRQFFETLAGAQTHCVSILGLRRAGKTSFLQYISHPEVMASFLPDPRRYLMIYVDVSACKTAAEFYGRVYRKLLSSLPRVPAGIDRARPTADVYELESLLYEFGGRRIVLLMDEFDQLRTANFNADFLTELRALAGVWDYELAYVTASYWDNNRLGNFVGLPPTSPFYNIFFPTPIYLSGLSPGDLEDLVKIPARSVGIVADDEDVAFIRHHAGTLPFFVQAVAADWLMAKAQGERPQPSQLNQRLASEMSPYFEQWWGNFSDVERDVATTVAQEKPVGRLPYGEQEIELAIDRLKCYGVLAATGDHLWPDSSLFAHWLREFKSSEKRRLAKGTTPLTPAMATQMSGPRRTDRAATIRQVYTRVQQIVEDVGAQFARLPGIYARKSDEELRDQLLLTLQSGLDNEMGSLELLPIARTDLGIGLEGEGMMAVKCHTWAGQKRFLSEVDQLMGLPTAHDAGAVLLMLVRNPEFVVVAEAVAHVMHHHKDYVSGNGKQESRQDYRLRMNNDPSREITVSIILCHLPG
ncbi:MAG: orc1/cdc6 family replication initiation protein [Candidatus Promineofilum sp.]|nr:orc1/cdc6 family replication initiation protein [Promineifilum sp.]